MIDPLIYRLEHEGFTIELFGKISKDVLISCVVSKEDYSKSVKTHKKMKVQDFESEETAEEALKAYALEVYSDVLEDFESEVAKSKATETLKLLSEKWSK